jgi:hypothetical protein
MGLDDVTRHMRRIRVDVSCILVLRKSTIPNILQKQPRFEKKSSARLQATGNGSTITVRPFTRTTLEDRAVPTKHTSKIRR